MFLSHNYQLCGTDYRSRSLESNTHGGRALLETITSFWNANSSNILVSLAIGFVFFVLGPIGLWFSGKKIRKERIRKAKEALIDLLESMLVSDAAIDERKLRALYRSVERETDVELAGEYQLDHWLGDVALRFERSRHLSPDQKQRYYSSLRTISDEMFTKHQRRPLVEAPRKYHQVLVDLKSAIEQSDKTQAENIVAELERSLLEKDRGRDPVLNVLRVYRRMYERSPVTFILATILFLALYFYVFAKFIIR